MSGYVITVISIKSYGSFGNDPKNPAWIHVSYISVDKK